MRIANELQKNPWIKINGDNLDIFIRATQQTINVQHRDRHFFTTIMLFSRVQAEIEMLSNLPPQVPQQGIRVEDVLDMEGDWKKYLIAGYRVIIGRILVQHCPNLAWMKPYLPKHLPHRYDIYQGV